MSADDLRTLADNASVKACPVPACALLADHTGPCMTLDAEEFHAMSTHDTGTRVEPAHAMAQQMSRMFTTTPTYADAVATLRRIDTAFTFLDGLMRSGAPLPTFWVPREGVDGHKYVTFLYDGVSGALRETGGPADCLDALREAAALWWELDSELADGSPLPEPWQRP